MALAGSQGAGNLLNSARCRLCYCTAGTRNWKCSASYFGWTCTFHCAVKQQSFQHRLIGSTERLSVASLLQSVALHLTRRIGQCIGTAFSAIIQAVGSAVQQMHLVFLKSWLHLLRRNYRNVIAKVAEIIMTNFATSFASGNSTCGSSGKVFTTISVNHRRRKVANNSGAIATSYAFYRLRKQSVKRYLPLLRHFLVLSVRAPIINSLRTYLRRR